MIDNRLLIIGEIQFGCNLFGKDEAGRAQDENFTDEAKV